MTDREKLAGITKMLLDDSRLTASELNQVIQQMSAKKPKPETHHPKPAPVPPDVALGTDGQYYHKIRDEHFTSIEERLNSAIHELVFACNHCENDSIPEAQEILTNTLGNLSGIQEELDALRVERDDQP